jgi:outer membrane protein assembly factor BamB
MDCVAHRNSAKRCAFVLAIACLILPARHGYAQDPKQGWPHVRGPNYDGLSTEVGLANQWPDEGPPVLWVAELGQGYSSIVVQNDRAYTQYQTLAGQYVICLDAHSGRTLWSYRYDWPFEATGLYPGPFSTPTLADDHVYFTTPAGGAGCLDRNGKLLWRRELKRTYAGVGTDFGYACSPTVIDGRVVLPIGGPGASIVALDAANGEVLWTSGNEAASYTPILPITLDGHRLLIGYLQNDLIACDLETGKQLWKQSISSGYNEHAAWPIFRAPNLWTSAPFQAGSTLWSLTGGPSAECKLTRHSRVMSNDVASSVLVGDTLFGFDLAEAQSKAHRPSRGAFRAIDWKSGKELWSNGNSKARRTTDYESNARQQTIGHATVLAADGKLFLQTDLGDLILAEATPDKYVELGRTRVLGGEIGWASPALDQGRLFIRNGSRAVCLFVGKQDQLPDAMLATSVQASELPRGEVYDLTQLLGVEPEYALDPPTTIWLWRWYLAGAMIIAVSAVLSGITMALFPQRMTEFRTLVACAIITFVLGGTVGTVASVALQDFVFTWPVCLFVSFVTVMSQASKRKSKASSTPRRSRASFWAILFFVMTCVSYFLVCRQLSLATELAFLCSFPAAVPFLLLVRLPDAQSLPSRSRRWRWLLVAFIAGQLAFAAYFVATVGLLAMRYDLVVSMSNLPYLIGPAAR